MFYVIVTIIEEVATLFAFEPCVILMGYKLLYVVVLG